MSHKESTTSFLERWGRISTSVILAGVFLAIVGWALPADWLLLYLRLDNAFWLLGFTTVVFGAGMRFIYEMFSGYFG